MSWYEHAPRKLIGVNTGKNLILTPEPFKPSARPSVSSGGLNHRYLLSHVVFHWGHGNVVSNILNIIKYRTCRLSLFACPMFSQFSSIFQRSPRSFGAVSFQGISRWNLSKSRGSKNPKIKHQIQVDCNLGLLKSISRTFFWKAQSLPLRGHLGSS